MPESIPVYEALGAGRGRLRQYNRSVPLLNSRRSKLAERHGVVARRESLPQSVRLSTDSMRRWCDRDGSSSSGTFGRRSLVCGLWRLGTVPALVIRAAIHRRDLKAEGRDTPSRTGIACNDFLANSGALRAAAKVGSDERRRLTGGFACQIFGSVLVRILVTTVRKSYDPFGTQD